MASTERRWAGPFRECPSCRQRNWPGRRTCSSCRASLFGTAPAAPPPERALRRRDQDALLSRPLWIALAIGLGVAALSAVAVRSLLRVQLAPPGQAVDAPDAGPRVAGEGGEEVTPARPVDPAEGRRAYDRGRRLLEKGDARAALSPLSEAAQALPHDAEVAHAYGRALWSTGTKDTGLFQLEKATRLSPGVLAYHLELARALDGSRQRARAAKEYGTVLNIDPSHEESARAMVAAQTAEASAAGLTGEGTDLGGVAAAPTSSDGRVFTNEDLSGRAAAPPPSAGVSAAAPAAPSPSPEPRP